MDRSASAAVLTEIAATACRPIHLLKIVFDTSTVYMTDAYRTITWDGQTWLAMGHFLSFGDIDESSGVEVSSCTIGLSGVDQTYISLFLSNSFIDREVSIWKGFLDTSMAVISSPVLIFSGRINKPGLTEDPTNGTCILAVEASSHWVDFQRIPGRHTNNTEQQIWYPGDKGFEFASDKAVQLKWGAA
jgi:hypothetical protein